jgi:uncharacterized protein YjbI with pentapeptide repeats
MLRYIFLSVFALLLLTACGNSDLNKFFETRACVECDLSGADLFDHILYGADLRGADLSGAVLSQADMSGADLSGANLSGAILFLTNLSDADLTNANLYGADLHAANFDRATGADFTGALNVPAEYLKD